MNAISQSLGPQPQFHLPAFADSIEKTSRSACKVPQAEHSALGLLPGQDTKAKFTHVFLTWDTGGPDTEARAARSSFLGGKMFLEGRKRRVSMIPEQERWMVESRGWGLARAIP